MNLIKDHFKRIDSSNAVLVANYDKNGVSGYVGGNSFLEMGKAFDKEIPIFLLQKPSKKLPYYEEIIAMNPTIIGENWDILLEVS